MKPAPLPPDRRAAVARTMSLLAALAALGAAGLLAGGCASAPASRGAGIRAAGAGRGGETGERPAPRVTPGAAPERAEVLEPPAEARASEVAEYRHLQQLYASGRHEELIARSQGFERQLPNSGLIGQVRNLRALSQLATRRPLQAVQSFREAMEANASPQFRQYVLYNLAAAEVEAGQIESAQQTLARIDASTLDPETRLKHHTLRARIFERRELPLEAAREILTLSEQVAPDAARTSYETPLREQLARISTIEELEGLYEGHQSSPLADLVLYRLGTQELILGRPASGESRLRELMSRFPDTPNFQQAAEMLRAFEQRKVVDPLTIGVLVPTQGKYARFGNLSLQAIELAFRIYNQEAGDGAKVTLVIEDSGEEPEQTVRALNRLFFKHHAIAVIGPLLSKGIDQVTQRAQELGMPLITLAQQPGVTGEYVIPSGLTPQSQAEAIARHAIERRGLKRFAILHPRDRFGQQYSQAFWDAVERLGGQVTGIESYAPGDTDFRQPVQKLVGTHYLEARQRELDELAKQRAELKITKRTRKTARYFDLPPIVDFDAVFIPDEPKVVGQILPTFAYVDVDQMQFLGISTWHSKELVTRAQAFAEGALFVDGFHATSESREVRTFVDRYRSTFGQEPGAIEALAYDAARMVEKIVTEDRPSSRSELVERLRAVKRFPGVTGTIDYRDGRLSRGLTVFTVQKGEMVEANK